MTPANYQRERKLRGTQAVVAAALDIERETVSRRETGAMPIGREAWLALVSLPKSKRRTEPGTGGRLRAGNQAPIQL